MREDPRTPRLWWTALSLLWFILCLSGALNYLSSHTLSGYGHDPATRVIRFLIIVALPPLSLLWLWIVWLLIPAQAWSVRKIVYLCVGVIVLASMIYLAFNAGA